MVFLTFAAVAEGAMVSGRIPSATVPPSTYGAGLINTPNPIDHSSNLPITGNVLGGKHFRGSIPYNSTTSFGAPLGSTSLDSFLRYSAVPQGLNGYPQSYTPFYSPSGTVTTTQPGYQGVFSSNSPRIAGGLTQSRIDQPLDTMSLTEVPQAQIPTGQYGTTIDPALGISSRLRYWPMSRSPEEMKSVISDELGDQLPERSPTQPSSQTMTPQEYQRQLEQLRRDIDKIKADTSRLVERQNLAYPPGVDNSAPTQQPQQESMRLLSPVPQTPPQQQTPGQERTGAPDYPAMPGEVQTQDLASLSESMSNASGPSRLRLYDPAGSANATPPPPAELGRIDAALSPGGQPGAQTDQEAVGRLPASQRIEETVRALDATSRFLGHPPGSAPGAAGTQNPTSQQLMDRPDSRRLVPDIPEIKPGEAPSPVSQPQPEKGIRPKLESSASMTQSQFDHYLAAAELYMQQGRYYRAVDSFTLALVYMPYDSRAHLGKSHALFAAGEYISSAGFLARAVELDARRGTQNVASLRKLNFVEIVGGPDPFVRRIRDLEENARTNDAPQLQFLLAYVYYQMDRPVEARTAIQAARKGLPSSTAANLLEATIGR